MKLGVVATAQKSQREWVWKLGTALTFHALEMNPSKGCVNGNRGLLFTAREYSQKCHESE